MTLHAYDSKEALLLTFLLVKPLAYFAFVRAYRYRVSRLLPMTLGQAAWIAAFRALLGLVLVGGAVLIIYGDLSRGRGRGVTPAWFPWWYWLVYLYSARVFSWWLVGAVAVSLRSGRLLGWVAFGTLLNFGIDIAAVIGLFEGLVGVTIVVLFISGFIAILEASGRRKSLQARFGGGILWQNNSPLCGQCRYNLTGNLSGVCPECGTTLQTAGTLQ